LNIENIRKFFNYDKDLSDSDINWIENILIRYLALRQQIMLRRKVDKS